MSKIEFKEQNCTKEFIRMFLRWSPELTESYSEWRNHGFFILR